MSKSKSPSTLQIASDLLICEACGTQYPVTAQSDKDECRVCDDPRQFVPPSGQAFSTLAKMKAAGYRNVFKQDTVDSRVWSIYTQPKFGIGQRAFLLQTPEGNVLWDLIAFLDEETVEKISSLGGIDAIVISHPHYYTTHIDWSHTFSCPIYTSYEDRSWIMHLESDSVAIQRSLKEGDSRKYITDRTEEIVPGVTAIKCGGHFEGSLCLHWDGKLFIADTLVTVPSGLNPPRSLHADHPAQLPHLTKTLTYTFMYSIPNMLPMSAADVRGIVDALQPFEFHTTHGAFLGLDIRDSDGNGSVKERVRKSADLVTGGIKGEYPT